MATVREALSILLSQCDGARARDGVGFNGVDAWFARDLNSKDRWTSRQEQAVYKMLRKYKKQLSDLGIIWGELDLLIPDSSSSPVPPSPMFMEIKGSLVYLYTRYDFKDKAKAIPTARWKGECKAWCYQLKPETVEALHSYILQGEINPAPGVISQMEEILAKQADFQNQLSRADHLKRGKLCPITSLPIKVKPYQHQIEAFNVALSLDNTALLMEQGTGKTLVAIALAGHRFNHHGIKRSLVVCPKSVIPEWERQFLELADFPYTLRVLTGSIAERAHMLGQKDGEGLQVAVINYEATWRMSQALKSWAPDLIIADESQKIKNGKTEQAKAMIALGKQAKYRVILTGTPLTQSPLDFFSQYRFLDSRIFGNSFIRFRNRYALMGGYGGYQVMGYHNLEELAEKAHSLAFRTTKVECLDLPDTVNQFRYAVLEPQARILYKKMQEDSILKLSETEKVTAPIILTELLRLQQITGGFLPVGEGRTVQVSQAKLAVLQEELESLALAGKQVVIFARFIPEVEAIHKITQKLNLTAAVLTGQTSVEDRGSIIKDFQEGGLQVFISQIATGGLGITLTAADTAIFFSTDFSLANYEQAKARLHRIGQQKKVTYIHILAQETIDVEVIRKLADKQEVAKMVVDEYRLILLGRMKMKPYEGLAPGTPEWMACWRGNPELQEEMLVYAENYKKGERGMVSRNIINQVVEVTEAGIEEQIDQAVREIEKALKEEGIEPIGGGGESPKKGHKASRRKPATRKKPVEKKPVGKKPVGKKPVEKRPVEKKPAEKNLPPEGEIITVKILADEFGTTPRGLRRWLRENFEKTQGRWEWAEGTPELKEVRARYEKTNLRIY